MWGVGCRVWVVRFGVQGSGAVVKGLRFKNLGLEVRVEG